MMPSRLALLALAASLLASAGIAPAQTPGTPPPTASSMLSPALEQLRETLSGLRLDKWKAPGPVREQASGNMGSITRDLDGTLPGLLATADASPGSVAKNLLVFRNLDALYDVLLRIVETADLSAPEAETNALHASLTSLESARRSLGDSIETAAVGQEQQVGSLQAQVQTLSARPPAPDVVDDTGKTAATHRRKPAVKKTPPPAAPQ